MIGTRIYMWAIYCWVKRNNQAQQTHPDHHNTSHSTQSAQPDSCFHFHSDVCVFVAALLLLFNGTLKSISNEYTFVRSFVRSMLENECKLPICNILDTWQIGNGMYQRSAVDWVFVLFHFDALHPTPQPTSRFAPIKQPVTTNI